MGAGDESNIKKWTIAKYWLPYTHANAIRAAEGATLAAVCDVNESAAEAAALRENLSRHYVDMDAMFKSEQLDAVAIATRTAERMSVIERAVESGVRAIYCEKPLANSLEESDRIARLIQDTGTLFVYGTRRRFMAGFQQAKELIEAGEIGKLTTIVIRFGRGLLLWSHPHSVDIASYFADDSKIEYVRAELDLDPGSIDGQVIDADPIVNMAHMKFENGVNAHIVAADSQDVELTGTKGMITIRANGSELRLRQQVPGGGDIGWFLSERPIAVEDRITGATAGVTELVNGLLHGREPGYNVDLAVANQEALFGFVQSHLRDGAKTYIPVERRDLVVTGRFGDLYA
jgi:predicted dehydrogenase